MKKKRRHIRATFTVILISLGTTGMCRAVERGGARFTTGPVVTRSAVIRDKSPPLAALESANAASGRNDLRIPSRASDQPIRYLSDSLHDNSAVEKSIVVSRGRSSGSADIEKGRVNSAALLDLIPARNMAFSGPGTVGSETEPLHSGAADAPIRAVAYQAAAISQQAREATDAVAAVEQTEQGSRPPAELVASFDGLGFGFEGPQGTARFRNPSDNSLAVGPNHVVQIVNTRMAVFTKKGERFDETGRVLYGPVETNNVFRGCGACGEINNGDAVVRYDQLADRWLIVMPIFRRLPPPDDDASPSQTVGRVQLSRPGVDGQPGQAELLHQPPPPDADQAANADGRRGRQQRRPRTAEGEYAMCYAVSTTPDPLGSYYRYQFARPLFPDYPRPAVWPDGYYVPTSTGDDVIQKHACVVDRRKMLRGQPATEQCVIIDDVSFLNNADVDGRQLPPEGAPNIMMATGGAQLNGDFDDDGIYVWQFHVDWDDPAKTVVDGPEKITVAPYQFLCNGQLTNCVPQPETDRRLDAQGDKIMARLVYRRIGDRESIVAVHSVDTSAGGGGVRWYEFHVDAQRRVSLYQQGTYAPGGDYRWMASPAIDAAGNIGIGYSFGGTAHFPGQRFAARLSGDPLGRLTLRETVLVEGEASQTNTLRWEDYSQTAIDPSDDCTIWYVGDYLKQGAANYSTRIGAFRLPSCDGDQP